MIAVLDNIRSSHNVGSMFRTGEGLGINKLFLCGITPQPLDRFGRPNKELLKTALGAEKTLDWEYAPKTPVLLDKLKKNGYTVYALEQAKKARPIGEICLSKAQIEQLALVAGNEVDGISAIALKRCDSIVHIPMEGAKESLNVAVAFGIATYALINNH